MLITAPGEVDLDVRAGTSAAEVIAAAGLDRAWCGAVELDPDHPAGVPPLVHGARLTAHPAPPCMPLPGPHLRVVEGPDAGHAIALDRPVLVGRGEAADLRLDDPAVSGAHALVTGRHPVRVRDVGSANGTATPRRHRLRPGQGFVVGRSRIVLVDPAAAPATASASPQAPAAAGSRRWGALAGGLASGATLAAMTGRWQLALVGVLPAAAPWLVPLVTSRGRAQEQSTPPEPGAVAVRGATTAIRGYVRAVAIERGRRPAGDEWDEPWMRWLDPAREDDRVVAVAPGGSWPSWCAVRVDVGEDRRVEDHGRGPRTLRPLLVSEAAADLAARRRASARTEAALPRSQRWGDLGGPAQAQGTTASEPRRLRITIGAAHDGPVVLDLDADGPHVLVAGTTGSGKSVALELIVSALARDHSPRAVTLALIDFKGGAGLRACMGLPHVAATLTDLDGALARRALAGLSHELAARKTALHQRGLASLSEWERHGDAPPRLVVVIDEYQEIVSSHPSFLPDLARLAAQGRSLGLHLVLATQRPAGAVTPEVRANVSATIALRVASEAESRDLLGTAQAARIPAAVPGRAILARGTHHTELQLAAPSADRSPGVTRAGEPVPPGAPLAQVAAARWRDHGRARPLWTDPLPVRWEPPVGVGEGIPVALIDRPAQRQQGPADWDPREGPAFVIGPPRSGRTAALRAFAAHARQSGLAPVWLPADPRLASRTLALASERPDVLLLIDDLEAALARLGTVDDGHALEDLTRRASLRLPTAAAGSPAVPARLASTAAVLAVSTGVDAGSASQWGVPRSLSEHAAAPVAGRAHVRLHGEWQIGQLASSGPTASVALAEPLPTGEEIAVPDGMLGVGGDGAEPVLVPSGAVTVVGPPGPARDAVLERCGAAHASVVELPALVPHGATDVVLVEPSPRAVRQLCPHGWRGVADPVPVAGRVVLVRGGVAAAVQLPSGRQASA
ncbi:FtsK/SpoIIIE domain-containing protein [Demequina sp. SO4-18]|uniref:FtsK/SpoIIIE domain-containing protein n=1 Tax=Demequina sp. SO4-18 TaxID=3401026 RepID=UPI003B5B0E51